MKLQAVNNEIITIKNRDLATFKKVASTNEFIEAFEGHEWRTDTFNRIFKGQEERFLKVGVIPFDYDNYTFEDLQIEALENKVKEGSLYFFGKGFKIIGQSDYHKATLLYRNEIYLAQAKWIFKKLP